MNVYMRRIARNVNEQESKSFDKMCAHKRIVNNMCINRVFIVFIIYK